MGSGLQLALPQLRPRAKRKLWSVKEYFISLRRAGQIAIIGGALIGGLATGILGNKEFGGPNVVHVTTTTTTTTPPPGQPTLFNVFASNGASGNDADATNCAYFTTPRATPPGGFGFGCKTITKAYALAAGGSHFPSNIGLYPGNFGTVSLNRNLTAVEPPDGTCDQFQQNIATSPAGDESRCITISPVTTGASMDYFNSNANFIHLLNVNVNKHIGLLATSSLTISDSCSTAYNRNVIIENSVSDGQFDGVKGDGIFDVGGGHNVSLIHNTWGNTVFNNATSGSSAGWGGRQCTNTGAAPLDHAMIKDSTMHDVVVPTTSIGHGECIAAFNGGAFVSFLNNRFENCVFLNFSLEPIGGNAMQIDYNHWTWENNYLDAPCSHCAALGYKVGSTESLLFICHKNNTHFDNMVVRNNSFYNKMSDGSAGDGRLGFQNDTGISGCTYTNNVVTGNILVSTASGTVPGGCAAAASVSKNLLLTTSGTGCTGADTSLGSTTAPYVNPTNYNFDLLVGSAGAGLGLVPLSTGFPPSDIYGTSRPNPADAGADQH